MERISIKVTWWTWCVPGSRRVRHHSWICRRNQPSPRSVAGPHPDWWPWRYGESGEVAPAPTDSKFTRCINLNQTNFHHLFKYSNNSKNSKNFRFNVFLFVITDWVWCLILKKMLPSNRENPEFFFQIKHNLMNIRKLIFYVFLLDIIVLYLIFQELLPQNSFLASW